MTGGLVLGRLGPLAWSLAGLVQDPLFLLGAHFYNQPTNQPTNLVVTTRLDPRLKRLSVPALVPGNIGRPFKGNIDYWDPNLRWAV